MDMPFCNFFTTPTEAERATLAGLPADAVLGCGNLQGEGPLFFFVPVFGGAVRVGVCPHHADLLAAHHGSGTDVGRVSTDDELRLSAHWGVAYKAGMLSAVAPVGDEESAREMVPLYGKDAYVVRCVVTATPWERVDTEGAGDGELGEASQQRRP
jgi:hypothetical protein